MDIGNTALNAAVDSNHKDTVKILIDNGANVCQDPKDPDNAATDNRIRNANPEIFDLLLAARAKNCRPQTASP
jgi:ankyrin repeat protein